MGNNGREPCSIENRSDHVKLHRLLALMPLANAADGLVAVKSPLSVKATADKVEDLAKQRGIR